MLDSGKQIENGQMRIKINVGYHREMENTGVGLDKFY